MTKQEFLSGLETALSGEVSQQVFLENMRYYQGYIEDELQKGRSEAEVLEELGSPRLIAAPAKTRAWLSAGFRRTTSTAKTRSIKRKAAPTVALGTQGAISACQGSREKTEGEL